MTERQTTTSDLGFAIRDFCEGFYISHFFEKTEHGCADNIDFIDASDANNLIFYMQSGAVFTVRIVRTG
jgi:hypothetical protein